MGFILVFVLLAIVLILLYTFSILRHGLGTQTLTIHYGWTYGPTAGELIHEDQKIQC